MKLPVTHKCEYRLNALSIFLFISKRKGHGRSREMDDSILQDFLVGRKLVMQGDIFFRRGHQNTYRIIAESFGRLENLKVVRTNGTRIIHREQCELVTEQDQRVGAVSGNHAHHVLP